MEKFKNYLVGVLMVVITILLLKSGCSKPEKEIVEVEKLSIRIDTIKEKEVLVKFKPILKPIHDTLYILDTFTQKVDLNSLVFNREYNDSLVDSNITLYSKVKVIGILDGMDLSYKLKPITIVKTISKIEVKNVVKPPNFSVFAGVELGGNATAFNVSPYINVNSKEYNYMYRFDLVNKTHNLGVGYRILSSKK
jgi:hypothetical protein